MKPPRTKTRAQDLHETTVSSKTQLYTLTVRTWRNGSVELELTAFQLGRLATQIAAALTVDRDEAIRRTDLLRSQVNEATNARASS